MVEILYSKLFSRAWARYVLFKLMDCYGPTPRMKCSFKNGLFYITVRQLQGHVHVHMRSLVMFVRGEADWYSVEYF